MRLLLLLSMFVGFIMSGCASSSLVTDNTLVATETSVVDGHSPVLFVIRNPEDGQWVFLTDGQANRDVVIYAPFQDLVAFDSTLNGVRDLPVGWKATRSAKGAPWVKEKFLANQQLATEGSRRGRGTSSRDNVSRHRDSTALPRFQVTVMERDEESTNVRRIELGSKSVAVWRAEKNDEQTSTLLWRDTLGSAASRSIDSLVQLSGLDTLKEDYAGPLGSPGKEFLFSIWDTRAERSTISRLRNCWVPALYELSVRINALLPKRYAMDLTIIKNSEF